MSVSPPDDALHRASYAERDAASRIISANERVTVAQKQSQEAIDQIRDEYEKQYVSQANRQEAALEAQRMKSYEDVRNFQRNNEAQLRKIRREGETEDARTKEFYRNALFHAEAKGKEELTAILNQQNQRAEYETKMGQEQTSELKSKNEHQLTQIRESSEEKVNRLTEENRKNFERLQAESDAANHRAEKNFQDKYLHTVTQQAEVINDVEERGGKQLKEIRRDTADKLAAYSSRQRDPFYKLMDLKARLRETNDSFVLTATIPEYEQKHFSAFVKGDNLVISGNRRNEEILEQKNGHTQSTSNFQSFTETFPLSWPVDGHRMTREFDGDEIIIRVPKKNEYAFKKPEMKKPEKARVEPPHFPDNIRHTPHLREQDESDRTPSPKGPGSGTLT